MKVSDYIWDYLYKTSGSRHVFLLSGGGMMHLLDSVGKSKFSVVPMHHEQTASMLQMLMAELKIPSVYVWLHRVQVQQMQLQV